MPKRPFQLTDTSGPALFCAAMLLATVTNAANAQDQAQEWTPIPLTLDGLELAEGAEARITTREGRPTLCLNGKALIPGLSLRDGSIAVDVANVHSRHFANIIFHANSLAEYETAYVRMHKSGQADALQYTPTFNNETNWQFYRGSQATAAFGDGAWVTLKVEFTQDRARISLWRDGTQAGAFETELTLSESLGGVGIRTLFEGCFSNLRYSTTTPNIDPVDPSETDQDEAITIAQWSLSDAFEMDKWDGLDEALRPLGVWQQVRVEPQGHLLISRFRKKAISGRFGRNGLDGVFAGVALHSREAQTVDFSFDASDMATVFLNGEAIYAFDNSIRAKGALFRGDIRQSSQTLRLSLDAGANELLILIAERANGWGLAGSIDAPANVRIEPLGDNQ